MTEDQRSEIIRLRAAGKGYGRIAQAMGISVNTIKSFCRRNPIIESQHQDSGHPVVGEMTSCDNCGKAILQVPKHKPKRFCCDKCRNLWWNSHLDQVKRKAIYEIRCRHCNKVFHVYGNKKRKYCTHACYIEERFKGGASHG